MHHYYKTLIKLTRHLPVHIFNNIFFNQYPGFEEKLKCRKNQAYMGLFQSITTA